MIGLEHQRGGRAGTCALGGMAAGALAVLGGPAHGEPALLPVSPPIWGEYVELVEPIEGYVEMLNTVFDGTSILQEWTLMDCTTGSELRVNLDGLVLPDRGARDFRTELLGELGSSRLDDIRQIAEMRGARTEYSKVANYENICAQRGNLGGVLN